MIAHTITAVSAAASVTGLLSNGTGDTWTLTANDCGDSLAHLITIKGDAATDHSAKTAIITGTLFGVPQTETVNLPNGVATVTSTKYFSTVATVAPSATINADTVDIGWAAGSVSPARGMHNGDFTMGIGCVVTSGTPTFSLQHSFDGTNYFNHAVIAAKTASTDGSYLLPVAKVRLAFTAAGGVTFTGLQADPR